ncbi:MAG: phospholipase D family protein [Longimicrobiales bacterium]
MLSPGDRQLYTDALRPPVGYRFAGAIATTYSLDLETLLTIPLHFALFSGERPPEELLKDRIGLLEALRRTSRDITVYTQASRVLAPRRPHALYGLLEPSVVEAASPNPAGAFHPKLWLVRFANPDTGATHLRLLVLTRNITADRCWDLVLVLEGETGEKSVKDNRELAELLRRLPELALRPMSPERIEQALAMADLASRTKWVPPDSFDRVHFHALGLSGGDRWLPDDTRELAVISPFLADAALESLLSLAKRPVALISRPEELALIDRAILQRFERVMILADQAEIEDGEEPEYGSDPELPAFGLHAKAYITKHGWDTHVYVGSANATNAALINGMNVELVAELIGKRSKVNAVEDVLAGNGFGGLLTDYVPDDEPDLPDEEVERARDLLERARRTLANGGVRVRFSRAEEEWRVVLAPERPLELRGVASVRAWLATCQRSTTAPADSLRRGETVELARLPVALLTSFVAFELVSDVVGESVQFVLSLGAENLPVAERDAAIVRSVIENREGFLRYVMLLLAEMTEGADAFGNGARGGFGADPVQDDGLPLFEHLTRAFCRQPERLGPIQRLIQEIGAHDDGAVVPKEFLDLWAVFQDALQHEQEIGA